MKPAKPTSRRAPQSRRGDDASAASEGVKPAGARAVGRVRRGLPIHPVKPVQPATVRARKPASGKGKASK